MKENVLLTKSFDFAVHVTKFYFSLRSTPFAPIGMQLFRSGTSIGANAEEAVGAASTKDFLNKITISYKEARETKYWLRLLLAVEYYDKEKVQKLLEACHELLRILGSIQKSTKNKLNLQ